MIKQVNNMMFLLLCYVGVSSMYVVAHVRTSMLLQYVLVRRLCKQKVNMR